MSTVRLGWDIAFPVEYVRLATGEGQHRLAGYAGPRFTSQRFEDALAATPGPAEDSGLAVGGVLGLKGRLGWFHIAAEGSVMKAPGLRVGTRASQDGWMFIPALSATLVLPFDDGNDPP